MRMTIAQFEVTFLRTDQGGRASLVNLDKGRYSPHLVVNSGPYLGVRFLPSDLGLFVPGVPTPVEVELLYEATVDYSQLETGGSIAIVEGSRVVGWAEPRPR
jgi:hypothetical protein